MFIYTNVRTGFDVSYGQTFMQNAVREETDGSFTILKRTIVVGGSSENVPAFRTSLINVTRENARQLAAKWIENGYSIQTTKDFQLEDIDAEVARKAARRAERATRRNAK